MNKRYFGSIITATFLTVAFVGGVCARARAQQASPHNPAEKHAGQDPAKAAKPVEETDGEVAIKLTDAPAAVQAAVAKIVAADKVTQVIKEEDEGITVYEVEYKTDGADASASFSAAGDVLEIEKVVKDSVLPAAAVAALKKDYPAATFSDHVAVQKFYYEVQVTVAGTTHEIKVDAAGNIDDEAKGGDEDHGHAKAEKHEGQKGEKAGDAEEDDDD